MSMLVGATPLLRTRTAQGLDRGAQSRSTADQHFKDAADATCRRTSSISPVSMADGSPVSDVTAGIPKHADCVRESAY
jgi:hypothetical protein